MFDRYYSAVRYLEGLSNLPLRFDYMTSRKNPVIFLERTKYFLDLLGNPERGLKYVHVSGTAGKGTVATMIAEMLSAAGHRTGLITSPAVTSTLERVRVDGRYIAPDEFANIVEYLKPSIDKAYLTGPYGRPSYFEITLAIALLYFQKRKCEWAVLEVGMGGRFDYTNVISNTKAAVITNVDYDHTEVIGPTLKKIAYEKAGIIKRGCSFITTESSPAILKIFKDECKTVGASFEAVKPSEDYQKNNEALAKAAGVKLGLSPRAIKRGYSRTFMPCRFEMLRKNNRRIVLDGAHNCVKMGSTVQNISKMRYRRLLLVLGFSEGKDIKGMLKQIVPLAQHIIFTRFQVSEKKCFPPVSAAKLAKKYLSSRHFEVVLDPFSALAKAVHASSPRDLVVVTGSFYLAGELRKNWFNEEFILRNRKSC